jgi:hypothetical protein
MLYFRGAADNWGSVEALCLDFGCVFCVCAFVCVCVCVCACLLGVGVFDVGHLHASAV